MNSIDITNHRTRCPKCRQWVRDMPVMYTESFQRTLPPILAAQNLLNVTMLTVNMHYIPNDNLRDSRVRNVTLISVIFVCKKIDLMGVCSLTSATPKRTGPK